MRKGRTGLVCGVLTVLVVLSLFAAFIGCGGGGGDSAPAVTVPGAPSNLIANAGDNSVTLSWSPVAGADSYNIYRGTAPGVTKTGTKVSGVQSPNTVLGLTNGTAYYFVVTAVNAAGESDVSAEKTATPSATPPPAAFSQADLTGTWDSINFGLGTSPGSRGWIRSVLTINGSGGVTVTSRLSNSGDTSVPPPTDSGTFTISSAGVISVPGDTLHFQMSSNKLLIFGTDHGAFDQSPNVTGYWTDISVLRKRTTGTVFTNADLANKTFTNHWLDTGISATDNTWGYASGTIDGSGMLTVTSNVGPSGPQPPSGSGGTLSVSSVGIVTLSGEPTFYGLMTDDKKVIFYIAGDINTYEFGVIMITGQTYTQSDYAGTWNFNTIQNAPKPVGAYGVTSIDAAGTGTFLSYTDSVGGATPANFSRILSASGVITDPANATLHGQLSYNKDISVNTRTLGSGVYGLSIGFK